MRVRQSCRSGSQRSGADGGPGGAGRKQPRCPHGALPADRRAFEQWLRNHGIPKRLAVRLAGAGPPSDEQAEEEQEKAQLQETVEKIKELLKELLVPDFQLRQQRYCDRARQHRYHFLNRDTLRIQFGLKLNF